jgi:iron-sulfur cluster repair protein YtfE (RIC family)
MSKLLEELKSEHKVILDILGQAKTRGISSRAGQEKLISARDLLMAHMRKEDEMYYPALRRAAENDRELKILLDYFVKDMEDVSKMAMRLFDRYAQGGDEAAFAGEIKLLYLTLKDRILTEEETLFEKFSAI